MAFNIDNFNNVSSGAAGSLKVWSYKNTTDSLATITGSGYFNAVKFRLNADDLIYVVGSDGPAQIYVTSANGETATTAELGGGGGSSEGASKAWGSYEGGSETTLGSFNIDSIVRLSTGWYRITFLTPFADNNYAIIACGIPAGNGAINSAVISESVADIYVFTATWDAADGTVYFSAFGNQ